jgi:hypothetical protein
VRIFWNVTPSVWYQILIYSVAQDSNSQVKAFPVFMEHVVHRFAHRRPPLYSVRIQLHRVHNFTTPLPRDLHVLHSKFQILQVLIFSDPRSVPNNIGCPKNSANTSSSSVHFEGNVVSRDCLTGKPQCGCAPACWNMARGCSSSSGSVYFLNKNN